MKKFSKALMMIVAVLLTFVLISSCFVSSTLAKYAVKKKARATATLEKFGVTLTVETPEGSGLTGEIDATTVKGGADGTGTLTYKISDVSIKPGDDYFNAARFTFDGAPTTDVKVTIGVNLDYTKATFSVPSGVGGATKTTYFMPLGFTFSSGKTSAVGNYALNPWKNHTTSGSMDPADVASAIRTGISGKITAPATPTNDSDTSNGYKLYNTFGAGDTIQWTIGGTAGVSTFDMGFAWPDDSTHNTYDLDVISTYLADKANGAPITITYFVTIEQIESTT